MNYKKFKNEKGITLIALVITIIVLLILAAISLNSLWGDSGILTQAETSKAAYRAGTVEEQRDLWFSEIKLSNHNNETYTPLEDVLDKLKAQNLLTQDEVETILDPENTNKEITINNKTISFNYSNPNEPITPPGEVTPVADILEPGDFVNYDAGTWTASEISTITNDGHYVSSSLPTTAYTFGGFQAGSSRNVSINVDSTADITNNPEFKQGWKVLSNKNGVVKIISAGTVEAFKHSQTSNVSGFSSGEISEYILRNGKPYNDSTHTIDDYIASSIIPRNFTMYENNLAVSGTAHCADIYDIYYIGNTLDDSTDPLRNLGIFYHIASAQESVALGRVEPSGSIFMSSNTCYGIRIVITLNSNVVIASDNTGDGSSYENAWKLSLSSN